MSQRFFYALEQRLRRFKRKYAHIFYAGNNVYCPICDRSFNRFKPAGRGQYRRPNAVCPRCAGRERDRFIYRLFEARQKTLCPSNASILHIAPEASISTCLMKLSPHTYVSGDLFRTDIDIQFDVEHLPFRDQSFDIVYCSHVLQAVADDDLALRETYRVLKDSGWALINVPVRGTKTRDFRAGGNEEKPADFVRIYGTDFADKLKSIKFSVEQLQVCDLLTQEESRRMVVDSETLGGIYYVKRR